MTIWPTPPPPLWRHSDGLSKPLPPKRHMIFECSLRLRSLVSNHWGKIFIHHQYTRSPRKSRSWFWKNCEIVFCFGSWGFDYQPCYRFSTSLIMFLKIFNSYLYTLKFFSWLCLSYDRKYGWRKYCIALPFFAFYFRFHICWSIQSSKQIISTFVLRIFSLLSEFIIY